MDDQLKSQPLTAPLLVRVDEAARLLSLGRSTVYALLANGALPYVMIGSVRRIPVTALERWVIDQIVYGTGSSSAANSDREDHHAERS